MTSMRPITNVVNRFALFIGTACFALSIGAMAQSSAAQDEGSAKLVSLADVARQQRTSAHPKAKRVVTNDDIEPSEAAFSQSQAEKPVTVSEANQSEKKITPEDKEKEKAKAFIEAIDAQKKRIATAQKKMQDLKTEQRQRASAQYADLGVLLRDPQKWNNDEKGVQEDLAKNQQEIDAANAQIEEIRERARKSGVRLSD